MSFQAALVASTSLLIAACVSTPEPRDPEVMQYDGAQLFAAYCANCHGASGEGNRTLATTMVTFSVPNLTLIRHYAGGRFPREEVRNAIAGTSPRTHHTSRTMPVWAWQFHDGQTDNPAAEHARVAVLIDRLVTHIESLQREPGE